MSSLKRASRLVASVFSTTPPPSLYGSVASHRAYILLDSPSPPSDPLFPSRFSTPLQRALQLQVTRWGGIVNFRWTGSSQASDIESTSVTAFSPLGGHIHFPSLSLSNVDEVAEKLKQHATEPPAVNASEELHIYVCTHGARDCRCGDMGGKVFRALREDIDRRILADPTGPAKSVVLGEVGHVGGHAFAANMLVFPHGEWLGQLTPEVVPRVLDAILSRERRPFTALDPPTCPEFWRGRMGLPKDEQLALHAASQ
ncbi:Sucrase/ferredoxin-like-domain-containing protein [Mycena metata]|uniref:Sucrase/ferredoxin-like-domain-containing protein n=1 Tax=Mycena metata TaxID=1033252 RepID=A0AAD7K6D7_9AGAR|nr:Sucrase/ferredoxin-like-domain-containing protein [Mycena metata]